MTLMIASLTEELKAVKQRYSAVSVALRNKERENKALIVAIDGLEKHVATLTKTLFGESTEKAEACIVETRVNDGSAQEGAANRR